MISSMHKWKLGGGLTVFVIIAFPLWREFSEKGEAAWNVFLAVFLLGLVGAALLLNRYFSAHADEIGEARFDTTHLDDSHG